MSHPSATANRYESRRFAVGYSSCPHVPEGSTIPFGDFRYEPPAGATPTDEMPADVPPAWAQQPVRPAMAPAPTPAPVPMHPWRTTPAEWRSSPAQRRHALLIADGDDDATIVMPAIPTPPESTPAIPTPAVPTRATVPAPTNNRGWLPVAIAATAFLVMLTIAVTVVLTNPSLDLPAR